MQGLEPQLQKVQEEYEQTLSIPIHKADTRFVLAPVGLVGAGKTTVVKPLSERLGLVRLSGDELRLILRKHGLPFDHVRDIQEVLIRKYLLLGYSVAVDSDSVSPRARQILSDLQNDGVKIIWIHINPPEEFILAKLKNLTSLPHYSADGLFQTPDIALDNYFRRKNLHEHLDMPFTYIFDTSKSDLDTQIVEAEKLIRSSTYSTLQK